MKLPLALLGAVLGTGIAIALLVLYGAADIGAAILGAGWGIIPFIAFHGAQVFFSAAAWRQVVVAPTTPSLLGFLKLRWIREAVNALLPVAQIGGEFVGARLLTLRGVPLSAAGASFTLDLTLEVLSQIAFALLGVALLVHEPQRRLTAWMVGGIVIALLALALFVLAQRHGMFGLIERGLLRFSEKAGWAGLGDVRGLHDAIAALYRDPRRLAIGSAHHFISWLLGGFEVMLALYLVGHNIGFRDGLIIESLGQALRAVGFAVPSSLGVQEGGYVLVCGLVGIPPQAAIELSLLKRIRELALGLPGLVAWQAIEGQRLALRLKRGRAAAESELVP